MSSTPFQDRKAMQQHERCEKVLNATLKQDLHVQWLLRALNDSDCNVKRDFFRCSPCGDRQAVATYQQGRGIVVCEDRPENESQEIAASHIRHELIHAFDDCRSNLSTDNCLQHACTEIRASSLSFECRRKFEIARGNFGFSRQFENCVRRRATMSIDANPRCRGRAAEFIDLAWKACYSDDEPFGYKP